MKKNYKIIFIGNFKNRDRMKYGKKKGPIQYFTNYCRRNHLVVEEINEFNTSKLCNKCRKVLHNFNPKDGTKTPYIDSKQSDFSKHKYCTHCKIAFQRDNNAGINIFKLGLDILENKPRPSEFRQNQ